MKLGTYIKWGMLSPNMVIKLVQWLSANKLCMRFVKPMKEWLKWD